MNSTKPVLRLVSWMETWLEGHVSSRWAAVDRLGESNAGVLLAGSEMSCIYRASLLMTCRR
jgi:hypothetical protein